MHRSLYPVRLREFCDDRECCLQFGRGIRCPGLAFSRATVSERRPSTAASTGSRRPPVPEGVDHVVVRRHEHDVHVRRGGARLQRSVRACGCREGNIRRFGHQHGLRLRSVRCRADDQQLRPQRCKAPSQKLGEPRLVVRNDRGRTRWICSSGHCVATGSATQSLRARPRARCRHHHGRCALP